MIKRAVLYFSGVLLLIGLYIPVKGQYYTLGQDPARTKWNFIDTKNFKIIYPVNYELKAQYLADALEFVYDPISSPLEAYPIKMPVILHNQATYSNASVAYAPRRMDFLTASPQDMYAQPWLDQLVLHEFRHAVHYEKMRQGFTKGLSYLFGEQTTALMLGLFVPFWFIEGDATMTETIFGLSGRGRVPSFEMKLKAQFLDEKIYNYDKATHGSFKDFTPNVYELGFHLIGQSQKIYGRNIWSSPLDRVARKPFTLVPFSHGLHLETGLGKVKLYRQLTEGLKKSWEEKQEDLNVTGNNHITTAKRVYTNYRNPKFVNDTIILAEKTRIDGIPQFFLINIRSGKEKKLTTPGVRRFTETLSISGNLLCWSERRRDPRWHLRDYAEVRTYDLVSGKTNFVTRKSRYFAPSLSPDGKLIAVVEVTPADKHRLVILRNPSGKLYTMMNFTGNPMILTPSWSEDGSEVVAVLVDEKGKHLVIADLGTGEQNVIYSSGHTEISYPVFHEHYILFSGAYNGIDNIYALDRSSKTIRQITSVGYGATNPAIAPDGSLMIFEDYTASGYQVALMRLEEEDWQPVETGRNYSLNLFEAYQSTGQPVYRRDEVPRKKHTSSPYNKGGNLFKFHSWGPLSIDASNREVNPGISLLSQNLLSTSFFSTGYEYNINEEASNFYLNYSYEGWYPVLDFRADQRRRKVFTMYEGETIELKWWETELAETVRLPLDFSSRRYFRLLQPSIGISYIHREMDKDMPVRFVVNNLVTLTYRLYYSQTSRNSRRDIFPRWGQTVDLLFRHDPVNVSGGRPEMIGAAIGRFYLPGPFRNHGIRLYAAHQERTGENNVYSTLISLPRGMTGVPASYNMSSMKFDYALPLFYPDVRLGPVMYIKRFKARLFADYLTYLFDGYRDYPDGEREHDYSFGIDITADFHLFSLLAPFDAGVRLVQVMGPADTQSSVIQLLFTFNIDSL
jgi:Tol biopolymer transport system component